MAGMARALVLSAALSSAGCCSLGYYLLPAFCYERLCPPPAPPAPADDCDNPPGAGRVLNKAQVLAILNERARRTTVLVARDVKIRARLIKQGTHDLEGTAALERPHYLRVLAEAVGGELWVGSNPDEFWLSSTFGRGGPPLFGRRRHLGKPCAGRLVLDPTAVFLLLGVAELDERDGPITMTYALGRRADPASADGLSFRPNDLGYYVLAFHRPRDPARPTAGLHTHGELWLSPRCLRPVLYVQYGVDGREHIRALLGDYLEQDGRLIPRRLTVLATVYDASGTTAAAEGPEVYDFTLADFSFETPPVKPEVWRGAFDPRNVPGWNDRRYIDADCDRPAGGAVGPAPGN
jgi:hypothetical protein